MARSQRKKPIARAWVKDHTRGDASLGFVRQDHVVTT